MRMFYTAWDPARRRFVVMSAVSPDGFRWTKKASCMPRGCVFVAYMA